MISYLDLLNKNIHHYHLCLGTTMRPYPSILCSFCVPSESIEVVFDESCNYQIGSPDTTFEMRECTVIVAEAGVLTSSGDLFTEECLENIAKENSELYQYKDNKLYMKLYIIKGPDEKEYSIGSIA